jgi:hypothetical protein
VPPQFIPTAKLGPVDQKPVSVPPQIMPTVKNERRVESRLPWAIISGANLPSTHADPDSHLSQSANHVRTSLDEKPPANRFDSPTTPHAETSKITVWDANNVELTDRIGTKTIDSFSHVFDQIGASFDTDLLREEITPVEEYLVDKKAIELLFANHYPF